MKILAIGDFHGKLTERLISKIKKEKPEIILCTGDFSGEKELGKLFWSTYGLGEEGLSPKIKRKKDLLEKRSIQKGLIVFKKFKNLGIPFYSVVGNWDPNKYGADIGLKREEKEKKFLRKFLDLTEKNFELREFGLKEFEDFVVVFGAASTSPGRIDKKSVETASKKAKRDGNKYRLKRIQQRAIAYPIRKKKYEDSFRRAGKKKPIIFLTHNCPYNTKLDKIRDGPAKGKHFGSFLEKQMIRRFKPALVICGHMHENQGRDKVGESIVVNNGAAMNGEAAIINFDEVKGKVKSVRFLK
jgi:Icc-related predicted phosphoesterase